MQRAALFVLASLVGAPLFAAEVPAFDPSRAKQLAGPPSEFSAMRPPSVLDSAIHSRSALLRVDLAPVPGSQLTRWQGSVPVDGDTARLLVFAEDGGLPAWRLDLASSGARAAPARWAGVPQATTFGLGAAQVPVRLYQVEGMAGSELPLVLESATGQRTGLLLLEGDAATELVSWPLHARQRVGDRFALAAVLDASAPARAQSARSSARVTGAVLRVTDPAGGTVEWPMREDPSQARGTWTAEFPLETAGDYVAQVEMHGLDARGRAFVRTAEHVVPAVAASLEVAGDRVQARRVEATRLALAVPVQQQAGGPGHYRTLAEVWGRGKDGRPVPVAWVGGMVAAVEGLLEIGLDERWIDLAGAGAPYELRNLRIEDPDRSVAVAGADRLVLDLPSRYRLFNADEIQVDESMRMGPRPAQGAAGLAATGKRLLLVHGYCSGGVWPQAQFSTASTFLDRNQNRSNDQFARLIGNFGASWNSFGIVAHSQGGMAALHLYSYYWSGLDNASGSRLLQSVGTPYQGTNLAGILATVGNWFGVGCGKQNDLTYSGASSWLAGIPSWARAKVNYHTTSFNKTKWYVNDYCNMASDLVLSDPEDGTVEQAKAQLPGAINRGHVTGQCHTASMRDPAQYLDASRNAVMNANAAR